MSEYSHETVATQLIEVKGNRLAYRRLGKRGGLPPVFLQYFNANLDGWDPVVTDALALDHDIVLVNGAGIVSSSGLTPGTVVEMAKHIGAFCEKLNLMIIWKQFEISSDQGKPE
jgi:hypothetical protein